MAKPDGRIEKGQRLSTAISARAWNRAQDAADIVLGVRPGVTAGSAASTPARVIVDMAKLYDFFAFPGMAVIYTGLNIGVGSGSWNQFGSTDIWPIWEVSWSSAMGLASDAVKALWARQSDRVGLWGVAQPLRPDTYFFAPDDSGDQNPEPGAGQDMIGIVTEPSDGDLVKVCISGPAVALVRVLYSTQTNYGTVRTAIAPRLIPGISTLNTNAELAGIMDIAFGGGIRIAEVGQIFYGQANVFPQIRPAEVFL